MNFLAGCVRVMRSEGILRGDTDAPTTFSDLQHGATIQIAQIAIQDELSDLASDIELPYEKTITGSILTVAGTRAYALASGFVRFIGKPMLYCSADNVELFESSEELIKLSDYAYRTTQSNPWAWYFEGGTTKRISFYPVPQAVKTYSYDYEADVSVTGATDTLPFHNEIEAQAFCRLVARRFKFLYQEIDLKGLQQDAEHVAAKATLIDLVRGKNPARSYAPIYR